VEELAFGIEISVGSLHFFELLKIGLMIIEILIDFLFLANNNFLKSE